MLYKDAQKRIEYAKKWNSQYYKTHRVKELERAKKRKQAIRILLQKYKETLSCSVCGENHAACLEFHHKNNAKKSFSVSDGIERGGFSQDALLSEIKKCIVLCANCHRKLHAR